MLFERPTKHYMPALDGLRAFAVLAVIFYHMHIPGFEGGLLGVTFFFVLSGYLITSLLFEEISRNNTIRLKRFWIRRIRRLMPAIILVLTCTSVACAFTNQDLLLKVRDDFLASLLWFSNWHYIVQDTSYFEALGSPSPLQHFWSLAIEEQFYLVWPLFILGTYKLKLSRERVSYIILVIACASALLMAVLFDSNQDPSRVYYGTDTRAFSLMIGSYAAYIYPAFLPKRRDIVGYVKDHPRIIFALGLSCLCLLGLALAFLEGTNPLVYWGGLFLLSIVSALLIIVVASPVTPLMKFFAFKPFVWMGKRSYGMYLWHFPIIVLLTPAALLYNMPWWLVLGEFALILGISHLSYEYVEDPIRKGLLGKIYARVKTASIGELRKYPKVILQAICALVLVAGCVVSLLVVAPMHTNELAARLEQEQQRAQELEQQRIEQEKAAAARRYDPVWVGDSVSLAAVEDFQAAFPAGLINAQVSRQFSVGIEIVKQLKEEDRLGKTIVLALGTNGYPQNLQEDLEQIGPDFEIYLLTIKAPVAHESKLNEAILQAAQDKPNVHVIDWHEYSLNHNEWFWNDATHLRPEGSKALVDFVRSIIGNNPDILKAEEYKKERDEEAQTQSEEE